MVVQPQDECPCGSGIEYRECHSPARDVSDNNHWRGPGFPQYCYFGYDEPFTGVEFENKPKGEIVLLKNGDRVPIAKFFTVEDRALACSAVVESLVVVQNDGRTTFSGTIKVRGSALRRVSVLLGSPDIDLDEFEATASDALVTIEKGNWLGLIGRRDRPNVSGVRVGGADWFRLFMSRGFLVEFDPSRELWFKVSSRSRSLNLFTLSLPFDNTQIACPRIVTETPIATCIVEVERETICWDLILHLSHFDDLRRARLNPQVFQGCLEGSELVFPGFKTGTRKPFSKPRKIYLTLSLPEESITIGKFLSTLENAVRTIAEHPSIFGFNDDPQRVLEADFRDRLLSFLKSMGYFAVAESTRREGFVDILLKREESEAIVEFKVWGRRKYKEVIEQVLGYGTAWTTEYATVMINPRVNSIVDKFKANTRRSPGFRYFAYEEVEYKPIQKLISHHYSSQWNRHFSVLHLIINSRLL